MSHSFARWTVKRGMRKVWKGLVVGGLTGVVAGLMLDGLRRAAEQAEEAGRAARRHAPDLLERARSVAEEAAEAIKAAERAREATSHNPRVTRASRTLGRRAMRRSGGSVMAQSAHGDGVTTARCFTACCGTVQGELRGHAPHETQRWYRRQVSPPPGGGPASSAGLGDGRAPVGAWPCA